tara:strand:- start:7773 stop:8594 length:822 start_codon:yes stop_codon:yes gene_type:complete
MTSRYSPEEEAKARTREWLRGVYKTELGRDVGQEGLDYWVKDIHDSGQTRNQVLSNIRRSDEKWLGDTYKTELGRDLGDEGRKYWMNDLKEGGQSREDVLANIRRSDEYKTYQAGTQPDTPLPIDIDCARGYRINASGDGCVRIKKRKPKEENPVRETNPNRPYNKYWDAIDSVADAGNRMSDDYYQRFLPQMRKEVMLGIDEIGAADRYHGSRYEGTPPDYTDPADLFKKYRDKDTGGDDSDSDNDTDDSDTVQSLAKRLAELESKYSISAS